ncbi:hypothetical protein ACCO45_010441 [Purpureocillium lilacinum]|uniref:Uncharacterized protein n=1 Tax=Purpureocillium lilacinum TaxID=33203 RepID=A0ACC4DHW1_PURLI
MLRTYLCLSIFSLFGHVTDASPAPRHVLRNKPRGLALYQSDPIKYLADGGQMIVIECKGKTEEEADELLKPCFVFGKCQNRFYSYNSLYHPSPCPGYCACVPHTKKPCQSGPSQSAIHGMAASTSAHYMRPTQGPLPA